jgi:REP element-mobilizing transposase RayT
MSRLRRPFLYDRYIFVTFLLLKLRTRLQEQDYQRLAKSLTKMREKHGFAFPAWACLPDIGTPLFTRRSHSPFRLFRRPSR